MDDGGLVERVSVSFSEGVGVSTGDLFQAFHSKGGVELGVTGGGVGGVGGNANVPAWALEASSRAVRATAATRIQAMARGVTARKLARARRTAPGPLAIRSACAPCPWIKPLADQSSSGGRGLLCPSVSTPKHPTSPSPMNPQA